MHAVEHTNRRGDNYYLQAGKTRTGKPRLLVRSQADRRAGRERARRIRNLRAS